MKKSQLFETRKYLGDISAICGMKDYTLNEGKSKGIRIIEVKGDKGVEFTISADKALDIPQLKYKGVNMSMSGKPGLTNSAFFVEDGARGFLKSFNGGLLTTGGLISAGAASTYDGRNYGLHGVAANTPAEMISKEIIFDGDHMVFKISGIIREACVFDENLVLKREILFDTETNEIKINDAVQNLGFEMQPLMLLYHINFGYPFLNEGARVYVSAKNVQPRDAEAAKSPELWDKMEAAQIGKEEQCYFLTDDQPNAQSFAMLVSKDNDLAAIVKYNENECPLMCEWKCMRAGDYALGLEPTTCGVMGFEYVMKHGGVPQIQPNEIKTFSIAVHVTDNSTIIDDFIKKSANK